MMKTTHMTGGFLAGAIMVNSYDRPELAVAAITVSVFGSLIADIDIHTSAFGRKVPWISRLVPHRGPTHSLIFIGFIGMFIWFIESRLALSFPYGEFAWMYGMLWGMFSHLVLDMMNYRGVQILWPLSKKEYTFPFISVKANGPWNTIFGFIFFLLGMLLILNHGIIETWVQAGLDVIFNII